MRIGIHASNVKGETGQYKFLLMVLDALFSSERDDEIFALYSSDECGLSKEYKKETRRWVRLGRGRRRRPAPLIKALGLDLILFPTWTDKCWEWGAPFVFAVHDLQHRLQPEFPEVSLRGEWEGREKFFSQAVDKAKAVLVDSEEGKRDLLRFYDCDPQKVKILPYTLPASHRPEISEDRRKKIMNRFNLPARFLFYPANFWPHKNHYRIIEAAAVLKKKYNAEIPLVFTGRTLAKGGTFEMCMALAESLKVKSQIYYPGYVEEEELAGLYRTCAGLVMPTYFGPTNIPYLEAFYHGCPVIASDIPGIREEVAGAALLVDPEDTEAISRAIYRIWTDEKFKEELVKKGRERFEEFSPRRFKERLDSIIGGLER